MSTKDDELDEILDKHYPIGRVVSSEKIDAEKADIMTKIMQHRRDKFKQAILAKMKEVEREARIDEIGTVIDTFEYFGKANPEYQHLLLSLRLALLEQIVELEGEK